MAFHPSADVPASTASPPAITALPGEQRGPGHRFRRARAPPLPRWWLRRGSQEAGRSGVLRMRRRGVAAALPVGRGSRRACGRAPSGAVGSVEAESGALSGGCGWEQRQRAACARGAGASHVCRRVRTAVRCAPGSGPCGEVGAPPAWGRGGVSGRPRLAGGRTRASASPRRPLCSAS